jgi:hypothetical protein
MTILRGRVMYYIIKCYCFDNDKTPNLVMEYKNKKTALKQVDKAFKSGYKRIDFITVKE